MAKYHSGGKSSSGNVKASPGFGGGVFGSGTAGLPAESVMKDYPKTMMGGPQEYNDSREGLDMLAQNDHKQIMKKPGGRY